MTLRAQFFSKKKSAVFQDKLSIFECPGETCGARARRSDVHVVKIVPSGCFPSENWTQKFCNSQFVIDTVVITILVWRCRVRFRRTTSGEPVVPACQACAGRHVALQLRAAALRPRLANKGARGWDSSGSCSAVMHVTHAKPHAYILLTAVDTHGPKSCCIAVIIHWTLQIPFKLSSYGIMSCATES